MRKMALNKRVLVIVSSLAAIPLTIALIAAASHRVKSHKLLQSRGFLGQTRSKTSVITTIPTHSQQQKEKSKAQPQSPWQGSETRAATMTTTTATISTDAIVADKDVITAPRVVPSPMVPSSTSDIAATADSKDIRSLEDNVNALVSLFEETMTEIRKERYDEQIKLLDSYKDLLQTHIKVADARRRMASKLKPGA